MFLITTDAFVPLAKAQARARGVEDLTLVVVKHPVGGLHLGEMDERVGTAVGQLKQMGEDS